MKGVNTVSVTVDDTSADREEMTQILRAALADFDVQISRDDHGSTVVTLVVAVADLWLAVLIAMNAVTSTGYVPTALTAGPATGPAPTREPLNQAHA
ncbi:MAG TPA: hypothetical protein VIT41_11625 [Microlunatus sp.]